ncbi:MAG: hypothetical protein WD648_16340 [Planctomycetaceae bacterium]
MYQKLNQREHELCEAYAEELDQYRRALPLVDSLLRKVHQGHDVNDDLRRLREPLNQVSRIDAQIQSAKRELREQGKRPGSQLQTVLIQLQQVLEELIQQTRIAEQAAQQAKDRLMPELDHETRTQRMRDAYQTVISRC